MANVLDCQFVPANLSGQQPEVMPGIAMSRVYLENLAIEVFRLAQLAALMVAHRLVK
jgi:hypothetical protein